MKNDEKAVCGSPLWFHFTSRIAKICPVFQLSGPCRVVLRSLVRRFTVEPIEEYAKSRFQG